MKYLLRFRFCIVIFLFVILNTVAFAQQSAQINYQGVARNADGSPVQDQAVSLRVSIRDGGANSTVVYSETRSLTTNKFGLFATVIGSPGSSSQSGNMTAIVWATGNKFLQVELDPKGGSNFQNLGTSQLQSVPYAIYASQALPTGNAGGDLGGSYPNPRVSKIQGAPVSAVAPQSGQVLRWDGTSWAPGDGPAVPTVVITGNAPIQASTSGTTTTLSLNQANALSDGYLSRTDWLLFSNKTSKEYVDNAVGDLRTYVDASVSSATPVGATATVKGTLQLAGDLSGTAEAPLIANAKISSAKLADGAVTDSKVAPGINASKVGLGNVNNTSDADKPVSISTQAALDLKGSNADLALKAPIASPTFTGTVAGITQAMVGLGNVNNTSDADKPISTATQAALDLKGSNADLALKAPLASPTFTGTVTGITQAMVGLGNVNNTSDADKPISTATQAALDLKGSSGDLALKAPIASPTFTGTVAGITQAMVGLGNVNNTSDADKPISTATQAALDLKGSNADLALKAPLASPTFTGTVSGITAIMVGLGNVNNTTDLLKPISTATQTALDAKASSSDLALKAPLASPTFTGTVSGITATMVGLGNVNNTTDLLKPISTATQTALDAKATLASPTFTGTVAGITKAMVGLGDVNNTSDADKPISTLTQTALDARELNSNKSTDLTADAASDTKYPSVKSVKTYVDASATADASTTAKGKIQLAGDLAGTSALPVIAAGAITDAKIAATAAIADTKLATISTAGKVANAATTSASANTASAIVARDASGDFSAGTITATLIGAASTAGTASNLAGGSAGLIPYQSAENTTTMLAVGTAGQVLQSNGAAAPSWVTVGGQVRDVADEFSASNSQTSFTLTQTPSFNSKVKMYINGIRIGNAAYSWTGATLTYNPANNGSYALTAGDRIQLDYYY